MAMFDDLIPAQQQSQQTPTTGGLFDDLIPAAPSPAAPPAAAAPVDTKKYPYSADNWPYDDNSFVSKRKTVNGVEYRLHKTTGAIYAPDGTATDDPEVMAAFGKTKLSKRGQARADVRKPMVDSSATSILDNAISSIPGIGQQYSAAKWAIQTGQEIADTPQETTDAMAAAAQRPDQSSIATDWQAGSANVKTAYLGQQIIGLRDEITNLTRTAKERPDDQLIRQRLARAEDAYQRAYQMYDEASGQQFPQNPTFAALHDKDVPGTPAQKTAAAFRADPWGVGRTLTLQSGPVSIPSVAGGIIGSIAAGRPGAAFGAGVPSAYIEAGLNLRDQIAARGADMNDPASRRATFEKYADEIIRDAQISGLIVGAGDAAGAMFGSGVAALEGKGASNLVGKELVGTIADALFGAAGEGGKQVYNTGGISDPQSLIDEGLGEVVAGGVQQGGMLAVEGLKSAGGKTDRQVQPPGQRIEPRLFDDLVPSLQAQTPAGNKGGKPATSPEGSPPAQDTATEEADILRQTGYSFEQIADMNPAERAQAAQEARQQGIEPIGTIAPEAPVPGTSAPAPGFGTRKQKAPIQTEQDMAAVRPVVNAQPSEAQASAGNYQKGHINLHGLDISIENPKGSVRRGRDEDGKDWASPNLPADYGYIKGTRGKDGDHVDVYIGPNPQSGRVFVIDQINLKDGKFDEHKAVLGADNLQQAVDLYAGSFDNPTYDRIGDVTEMSVDEFKAWSKNRRATKRPVGNVQPTSLTVPPRPQFAPVDNSQNDAADKAFDTFIASRKPITQEAFAAASGLDIKDAGRAIQRAALAGRVIQGRNGAWRRPPTRSTPIDAMDYIASIGGIRDVTGELAGMDLPKIGPFGPPVRKNGLHPDQVLERLIEAGYLRDPGRDTGGQRQLTVNDVYDLLARHMGGQKAYSIEDQAKADEIAVAQKNDQMDPEWQPVHPIAQVHGVETWDKVQAFFAESGTSEETWSPQEVSDAARLVAQGMDAGNAFERAAFMQVEDRIDPENEFPEFIEWLQKRDKDAIEAVADLPPFPDVETPPNAAAERTPEASPSLPSVVEEGNGPQNQADAGSDTGEVPGTRPVRGEEGQAGPVTAVEPGADNRPQLIIPGAEQATADQVKKAARDEKAAKELAIRQKQSKLRKGGQKSIDEQEGGMFAPAAPAQTTLLDATPQTEQTEAKPNSGSDKPNSVSTQTKPPPAKIEDFGEKIIGARKDAVRDIVKSLTDDIDVTTEPLSKTFPQPDYVKMAEAGVDREALAYVALFRAEIPTKPQKSWKVKQWSEQVKILRDFSHKLLSGQMTAAAIRKKIYDDMPILAKVARTAEIIKDIEPKYLAYASQYSIASSQVSVLRGQTFKPAKQMFLLETDKQRWTNVDADTLEALREPALAFIRKKAEAELGADGEGKPRRTPLMLYKDRFTKEIFIGFKGRVEVIRLKTGFKDVKEARLYMADKADELQAQIDAMRQEPDLRRAANAPRSGPPRRPGDATPETFQEAFGFRGVQFGNYVEGDRRQSDLNEAFDALMDLSDTLGIPSQALSLGGKLGIAFGARGHGGKRAAAAHYEPGQVVINLTKHAGPGSLAHEWLHALDNYFARLNNDGKGGGYISEAKTRGDVRESVWQAWKAVEKSIAKGSFAKRSDELDAARSKAYYGTTIEKAARAFERYIVDRLAEKQTNNDYLANIDTSGGAFPTAEEMQEAGIRAAFDDLFAAIEVTKNEIGQAVLSSRANRLSSAANRPVFYSGLLRAVESLKQDKAPAAQWLGTIRNTSGVKPEEVAWLGLDDWLSSQTGTVTKAQIADFVRANQVQVREVEKGGTPFKGRMTIFRDAESGTYGWKHIDGDETYIGFSSEREAADSFTEWAQSHSKGSPKFGQYQLPGGPLSRDTEILTDHGWKRIDQIRIGDVIMTRADNSGLLEWQPVEAVPTVHAETLYHFFNQSIDMQVTDHHQMVVKRRRRSSQGEFRTTAAELWKMAECVVPLAGTYVATGAPSMFGLPAGDVAEFIGWYLAEGSHKDRNGVKTTIQIAQCGIHNPENCKRLEALFDRLGFSWKNYGGSYGIGIRSMPFDLKTILHEQPTSGAKYVPPVFFRQSSDVISRLLEGLILGDGCTVKADRNRQDRTAFFTKSQRLAGDVQALVLLTGKRAAVRQRKSGLYVVTVNRKKWAGIDDAKHQIVPYNDTAYCVTVKNHAIYVRRNGVAAFTGNSNYRELLLTLPGKSMDRSSPKMREAAARMYGDKFVDRLTDAQWAIVEREATTGLANEYRSGHWDEPNVVAHVRFNERTVPIEAAASVEDIGERIRQSVGAPDVNSLGSGAPVAALKKGAITEAEAAKFSAAKGYLNMPFKTAEKVLFIEEVQSDWHQSGRKKGYNDPRALADTEERLKSMVPAVKEMLRRNDNLGFDGAGQASTAMTQDGPESWEFDTPEDLALAQEYVAVRRKLNDLKMSNIPDAPFKTTWPELAMKRMVRWAAQNGFDRIAWTPGDVQAERYDLSKQIDRLDWTFKDGLYRLYPVKNGGVLQVFDGRQFKPDELEGAIGKEVSKQIIDATPSAPLNERRGTQEGTITADGLKVGGQGMVGFYDKILVDTARKLGKKFGATVGRTSMPGGASTFRYDGPEKTAEQIRAIAKKTFSTGIQRQLYDVASGVEHGDSTAKAMQERGSISAAEAIGGTLTSVDSRITAHSMTIPAAMRDAAMEGQPLFARPRTNPFRFILPDKQRRAVVADVQQTAQRILGHHLQKVVTALDLAPLGFSSDEDGVFDPNTGAIWVALQGAQDPRLTIRHEGIHALRQAGVFTPQEWAALARLARTRWIDQHDIRNRYEQLYRERFDIPAEQIEELLVEEAIAEAFADYRANPRGEDLVSRIFDRVMRFLEAVANMARGNGYRTSADVFGSVDRGEVAGRQRGQGQSRDFLLYGREEQPLSSRRRTLQPPRNAAPGSFDAPHDERVMAALTDSTSTILDRIRRAGSSVVNEYRRKAQDREVDLLRTQGAITKASGRIAEPQDAYLAASLYPGRVAQRDRDLVTDVIEPLITDIARRKLTLDEVDTFNRARHAFERNLAIGQLYKPGEQFHDAMYNPSIVGGSGLSDDQAGDILNDFQRNGKYADLEAVGDKIVALNRQTIDKLLTEGLLTQEQHDAMTAKYRYYVPLRGYDEATDETHPDAPRTGSRYDVRGQEVNRAFGRTSQSDSPLAYSIMQARQAIIRIEKNRVGKRFLRLAQANPNEAFWQVNRRDRKKIIDKNTGLVRYANDPGVMTAENVLAVKVGGQVYHVTLHHKGLAAAMKGMGTENMHSLVIAFHKINRYLAGMYTSYSPEFIFTNLLRDMQQTGIVLQEEKIKGLTRSVVAALPKAAAGMNAMLRGDLSSPWARYARDYADAGGKMGFMGRNDIETEKRSLDRLMREQNPSKGLKAWMLLRDEVVGRLDRYNDSIENTLRLSTYVALRNAGISRDKAAFSARELTINFNRKGEWSSGINAFYLFFNAASQGAASMVMRFARSKAIRRVCYAIMVSAFLQDMLNRMLAGDDDDGENRYDKIPDEIKARNGIVMFPKWLEEKTGTPYLKWPLPLGYNMFHVAGTQVGHAVAGARTPLEASAETVSAIAGAFNPLGGGAWSNMIAPTLLDPFADIWTNRNFFGDDITPRVFDETTPNAQRYKDNISPGAKAITDFLSEATGGSPERKGAIDWSPEWVEHIWEFAAGGIGRMVNNTQTTARDLFEGSDVDASKVPFARTFVGQTSKFSDRDAYYEIKDAVHVTEKEFEARQAEGDAEAVARIQSRYARELSMIKTVNEAEKKLAKLRKDMRAVKALQSIGSEAKRTRLDEISRRMDAIQLDVRRAWNADPAAAKTAAP